jgi:Fe-S cluster biosynthesis and repair protein YggX
VMTSSMMNLKLGGTMARIVKCVKLGKEADGLDFPPYPGELGKKIFENVSKQAWADWLKQQTMLLNENRLSLVDPQARKYLTEQTEAYFFGSGADTASGYVPPTK